LSKVSICGSSEESEAAQIGLGPASADEEITNDVGGKGIIGSMVVDYHTPAIGVAIDALTALALSELKTLVCEGPNDAADRDVAQERNRWMVLTHMVMATTGASIT
jgi:hypothetical protein